MSADHHKTKNKINVSKCTFIYFLLRKVYLVLPFARSLIFNNESGFSHEDPDHNYLKRSRSPGPLNHTYHHSRTITTGKQVQKARANPSIIREYKKVRKGNQSSLPNVGTSKILHMVSENANIIKPHYHSEINTALRSLNTRRKTQAL